VTPAPLLMARNLRKHFPLRGGVLHRVQAIVQAVDDVSFEVREGETLGIVGESGCGKSTTARLLMHLIEPDAGEIRFAGRSLGESGFTVRELRRQAQMVFQDSYASLNPRLAVQDSIAFGPQAHGVSAEQARAKARDLLALVKLDHDQFGLHDVDGVQALAVYARAVFGELIDAQARIEAVHVLGARVAAGAQGDHLLPVPRRGAEAGL